MSLLLTAVHATASAQGSTPDSCICYTDAQDIRCLECLINAEKRADQVENLQDQLSLRLAEVHLCAELTQEQAQVIGNLQAELAESERKRERLKNFFAGALAVIAAETLLLLL